MRENSLDGQGLAMPATHAGVHDVVCCSLIQSELHSSPTSGRLAIDSLVLVGFIGLKSQVAWACRAEQRCPLRGENSFLRRVLNSIRFYENIIRFSW
jgi:hypothetical protein